MRLNGRGTTTTAGTAIALGILLVIGLAIYAALHTDRGQSAPKAAGVNVTIEIGAAANRNGPGYSPATTVVVIGVNNTVTWTNADSGVHTVTANGGSFDSHDLGTGKSFTYTFSAPGTFDYHCAYHSWMEGSVEVKR